MTTKIIPLILIVSDAPSEISLLGEHLHQEGFELVDTSNAEDGLLLAETLQPNIIILDCALSELSAIGFCNQINSRQANWNIPIIMLNGNEDDTDRVQGLDAGADEYISKPYSLPELVARIHVMIRGAGTTRISEMLTYAGLVVDASQHRVTRFGKPVRLGPIEFKLLSVFIEKPNRVWDREALLDRVWSRNFDVDTRTVDVHIGRLRKTLFQKGRPDPIRTVRGFGYSLDIND